MTSSIAVVAIDAVDVDLVVKFWCDVLGWIVLEQADGITSIGSSDSRSPTIDVCRVPERKRGKNRLHFDVRAAGITRDAELQRLLALGANPVDVGQPPDASWVVLADPEGNEFCLLARTVEQAARD